MLTIKNWRMGARRLAVGFFAVLALVGCTPAGPRALLDGERLLREGKYPKAIVRFQKAVQFLPSNAQAWNHLGLAYHKAGQLDAALQAYERARRCDLNLTPIRYNLGCLLLDRNEPQAAAAELTTYTLLQPDSVDGWTKLGTAQLRSRQWDAAERSFLSALHLRDDLPEAWNGLGICQVQRRRAHDARDSFTQALQRQTNFAPALLNLAVLEQRSFNSPTQALQHYRDYLRLQPHSPEAAAIQENIRTLQAELSPPARTETALVATPRPPSRISQPTNPAPRSAEPLTASAPRSNPGSGTQPTPSRNSAPEPSSPATSASPTVTPKSSVAAISPSPGVQRESSPSVTKSEPAKEAKLEPGSFTDVRPTTAPPNKVEQASPSTNVIPVETGSRILQTQVTGSVEVVRIPALPPPAIAKDSVSMTKTQEVAMVASGGTYADANALLERTVRETRPEAPQAPERPKTRVLDRLNPVTWFRGKRRTTVSRTEIEPLPTVEASEGKPPVTVPKPRAEATPSPDSQASLKRYAYRSPEKPLAGNRTKADPLFAAAVQEHRDGHLSDAIQNYQRAIQQDAGFFEAHYNLGLAAYEMRDYARSLSAYESALSINPTSVNARYNFALALQQAGYFLDAAKELEKLLQQNPDEARAHLALASLYAEKLGEPAAARPHYRRLLELDPQHPQAPAIRYWLAANP